VRLEVTEAEVKRAVWMMAPNKASELDGITVFRKAWGIIGTPLNNVLNKCLMKSEFPDCWKTAEVITIRKGENRDPSYKDHLVCFQRRPRCWSGLGWSG